jgi:hypothetical protein
MGGGLFSARATTRRCSCVTSARVAGSFFFLGVAGCYLLLARHFGTVNFWVGFMRTASPKRRLDVKMALLAAELIVDPAPPGYDDRIV